jgi:hypothetical protein
MKYLYVMQNFSGIFWNINNEFKIIFISVNGVPTGHWFLFLHISLDSLITFLFYQGIIFVMCHVTCVLLKNENMHIL